MNTFNTAASFANKYKSQAPDAYRDIIPEGYNTGQLKQFSPEQMQLFSQLFKYMSPDSPLGRMASGDQSYFDEMEAPALRQAGQLQGNLASRFSGMGMGGRHSSGFQNTSSQAMNEFAKGLQSKRQDYMRQAINELMNYSNMLLGQRPYERFLEKEDQGDDAELWGKLAGFLPGLLSAFSGGGTPAGAAKGSLSIFGG